MGRPSQNPESLDTSAACEHLHQLFPHAGVPKETFDLEKRVALSPASVAVLRKAGFKAVLVEEGAGHGAQFTVSASLTCKLSPLLGALHVALESWAEVTFHLETCSCVWAALSQMSKLHAA